MAQAIINTALDAFVQTDETGSSSTGARTPKHARMDRSEPSSKAEDLIVPELQRTATTNGQAFLHDVGIGAPGAFEAPFCIGRQRDFTEMSLTELSRGESTS